MKTTLTSLILLTLLSPNIFADYVPSITLEGHTDEIRDGVFHVLFSPDGRTLASKSQVSPIQLWDVATGREKHTFKNTDHANSMAFSPDGRIFASWSGRSPIQLWDVVTGRKKHTLEHYDSSGSVAFSPDGRTLASGGWNTIYLWDIATGKKKHTLEVEDRGSFYVAFSPDGRTLASGGWHHTIWLWDVAAGKKKHTLEHIDVVEVVFSPDGRTLTSLSLDTTIGLWDVATGRVKHTLEHSGNANSIAFSPDGRTLASGGWYQHEGGHSKGVIRLWDVATGREKHTLEHTGDTYFSVAFSPDGRTLASGGQDGIIRLWNMVVDTRISVTPDSVVSPAIGEQLSINVSIDQGENVGGYQFTVIFDPTALRYVGIAHSDYLPPGAFAPPSGVRGKVTSFSDESIYPIRFVAVSLAGTGNGDGTLATLTFEVVAIKESIIQLSDVILTDSAGRRLPHLSYSGAVTDPQIRPEDVNTDGVVNILDLVKAASRFNQRSDIDKEDVNKDGVVDIRDLILVAGAMDAEP